MPVYTSILNLLKKVAGVDPGTDKFNIQSMLNDNWDKIDAAMALKSITADVRAATTANITLSATQTVDGVSLVVGDRVLVKNQTTGSANGIYVVASGSWTRSIDMDSSAKLAAGLFVFVREGTANGGRIWRMTNTGAMTLGTTALTFIGTDSAATASAIIQRDASGRAKVAAPSASDDIAIKSTVDAVQTNLNTAMASKQPLDSTLTALSSFNTNGLLKQTAVDTFTAVAAPVGAVVGTTDTQTLTNKSISGDQINSGTVPVARMPTAIPATSIGVGSVDNTEFGYLDGVTGAIQTQLNAKAASSSLDSHLADYTDHIPYAVTGGSANTYTVTLSPALGSYTAGVALAVNINITNTGASTINVNGLGAKSILDSKGNAMAAGKLRATSIYTLRYNGTAFILQGEGGGGTAVAADILAGKTATIDSGDVTGTMVDRSGDTAALSSAVSGTTLRLRASDGYRDGSNDFVTITDANFIAANILAGMSMFGLTGTGANAKRTATGTALANAGVVAATGLSFRPSVVVLIWQGPASGTAWFVGVLLDAGFPAYNGSTVTTFYASGSYQQSGGPIAYNSGNATSTQINSNGFSATIVPFGGSIGYHWIAYE